MNANEIRKKYLEFFKSKNHSVIASDSVVPKDDPTVLFTTAGMQQFKRQFLGHIDGFTRATTSQKCLRTDDLDKIGKTPCHHTFFEMLGNFSFGDYFKKEAIAWAWEFLTQEVKLSGDRLWVSVYEEDNEAYDEWVKMGFPKEKIIKLGDKDNFWPAEAKKNGPNGPCGPCSEIFFDYFPGGNPDCKNKKCDPSCNCGRFTEIWNLVFTQFNRKDGGILEPLPGKNIDTGMGLERLTAVIQGKKNNYDTDLFQPLIEAIDIETKTQNYEISLTERRIVADHIRAIVFAISDGVVPSNEGRGYVVKKLIIDATDIMVPLGKTTARIYKLAPVLANIMEIPYPEIKGNVDNIAGIIRKVQESYLMTRNERVPELDKKINDVRKKYSSSPQQLSENLGLLLFEYKDTFGLAIPTLDKILKNQGECGLFGGITEKAWEVYGREMTKQQDRSRAGSKMTGDRFANIELELAGTPKTKFTGYTNLEEQAKVLKLYVVDKEVTKASTGDAVKVILDQTPFYAESGGQIGDAGTLTNKDTTLQILDTQKQDGIYIHMATVEKGEIQVGDTVEADVDEERRLSIMRNHTATHILQAGLRKILGSHVQQQGSLVAEDRLRFDFTHPQSISAEQKKQIEDFVNSSIKANDQVDKKEMPIEEARKLGALSFFAEKYGAQVRVVSIGNFSKEFCGGTHLNSTGEIQKFKLTSEGAVAQGIRRVEARTADFAVRFEDEQKLEDQEKLRREQERQKQKVEGKEYFERIKADLDERIKNSVTIKSTKIVPLKYPDLKIDKMREISDLIKQKQSSVAVIFGTYSDSDESAYILIAVTADLEKAGITANGLIKELLTTVEGNGGDDLRSPKLELKNSKT